MVVPAAVLREEVAGGGNERKISEMKKKLSSCASAHNKQVDTKLALDLFNVSPSTSPTGVCHA